MSRFEEEGYKDYSLCSSLSHALWLQNGNELEMQKLRSGEFWERVNYVFNYLDAFLNGLGDGIVTVGTCGHRATC